MRHVSETTRPLLASIALRNFLFWSTRCVALERGETTQAERDAAARQRDAFSAQYQILTAETASP